MTITTELRKKVAETVLQEAEKHPGSDRMFSRSIGISNSVLSRIRAGETDRILRDAEWIRLARMLNVEIGDRPSWKEAQTNTFKFINAQLKYCQSQSVSRIFCDVADMGKTFAARYYQRQHRNVVYIDCSQHKTKRQLIRALAQSFGTEHHGKLTEVQADLTYFLRTVERPLIILDEAGDLNYDAFLEIKALWNATEDSCGWYLLGADGLARKINRNKDNKKVGYAEIFRRFGSDYMNLTQDMNEASRKAWMRSECEAVLQANMPSVPLKEVLKGKPSLTLLKEQINKYRLRQLQHGNPFTN